MTEYNLTIRCESTEEFEQVVGRFLGATSAPTSETRGTAQIIEEGAVEPAKPARGRKAKAETSPPVPTQNPDGSPIPPTEAPVPQPTPGGTEAPPAESIPPNQPPQGVPAAEQASATPAASSPADDAAAASGEVTVQMLKDSMAGLLKAKSASTAMKVLEEASGCKSLTTGSPNVVEKAKDDPAIMRKVLDALNDAAVAA